MRTRSHANFTFLATLLASFLGLGAPLSAAVLHAEEVAAVAAPASEALALFKRVLDLNRVQEPDLDADKARHVFEELLEKSRAGLDAVKTPEEKIAVLNQVLLLDRKVTYLANMHWRDATLAAVLLRAKGNCLATSTLYLTIGAALKLPIKLVLMPGHAFVRWDDGDARINIETTAGGKAIEDAYYRNKMDVPADDIRHFKWFMSLESDDLLATLTRTAADFRIGEGKLEEGLTLLDETEKLAPYRTDIEISRYMLMADISGRRTEAREKVHALLRRTPPAPNSVAISAFKYLAQDAGGMGQFDEERQYLMQAFQLAPKFEQYNILSRLAYCYRSLKDDRGAVRCMELATLTLSPGNPRLAGALYGLASMQKCDGHLKDALLTIERARTINPESWNLKMQQAGYLVLDGKREEGLKRFEEIETPHGEVEFYRSMRAWFFAVSQQREKFYEAFEYALTNSRKTHILEWIAQDTDLDVYRNEPEFKALVEKHAKRLRGE